MFVDFLGYDETAHRRGPGLGRRRCAASRAIDQALATIFAAADAVPELGYEVHVLSDHGHVRTVPFEIARRRAAPRVRRARGARRARCRAARAARVGRGLLRGGSGAARPTASRSRRRATSPTSTSSTTPVRSRSRGCARATGASSPRSRASRAVGLLAVRGGARGFALVARRGARPRRPARTSRASPTPSRRSSRPTSPISSRSRTPATSSCWAGAARGRRSSPTPGSSARTAASRRRSSSASSRTRPHRPFPLRGSAAALRAPPVARVAPRGRRGRGRRGHGAARRSGAVRGDRCGSSPGTSTG